MCRLIRLLHLQAEAAAQRASEQADECELSLRAAEQLKVLLEEKIGAFAALEAQQKDVLRERDEINAKVATVRFCVLSAASFALMRTWRMARHIRRIDGVG